jgi:hypothetical protein
MPLPGHQIAGPDRPKQNTMDHALDASLNAFAITFADRWRAAETY